MEWTASWGQRWEWYSVLGVNVAMEKVAVSENANGVGRVWESARVPYEAIAAEAEAGAGPAHRQGKSESNQSRSNAHKDRGPSLCRQPRCLCNLCGIRGFCQEVPRACNRSTGYFCTRCSIHGTFIKISRQSGPAAALTRSQTHVACDIHRPHVHWLRKARPYCDATTT